MNQVLYECVMKINIIIGCNICTSLGQSVFKKEKKNIYIYIYIWSHLLILQVQMLKFKNDYFIQNTQNAKGFKRIRACKIANIWFAFLYLPTTKQYCQLIPRIVLTWMERSIFLIKLEDTFHDSLSYLLAGCLIEFSLNEIHTFEH